jgi:hypothetical protein
MTKDLPSFMHIKQELTKRSVLWYCILLGMILAAPIVGSAASPSIEDNHSVFKSHAGEIRYLKPITLPLPSGQ